MDEKLNGEQPKMSPPRIVVTFNHEGTPDIVWSAAIDATHMAVASKWLEVLAEMRMGQVLSAQLEEQGPRVQPASVVPLRRP